MQTAVLRHTVFQKINLHAVQVHAVLAIKSLCPWRDYKQSTLFRPALTASRAKQSATIYPSIVSMLKPAAEPQLQLEGMLLKLNSGSRKNSRRRQHPNKRVTLRGMAGIVRVYCMCVCVREESWLLLVLLD